MAGEQISIDLDAVGSSEQRFAKIGGQTFEVKRMGLHQIANLYKLWGKVGKAKEDGAGSAEDNIEALSKLLDLLDQFVPGLSASGVNMTLDQLGGLIQFAVSGVEKKEEGEPVPSESPIS